MRVFSALKDAVYEATIAPFQQAKQPYQTLDPHIAVLVDALNRIDGLTTIASCQGHVWRSYPYVYFTVEQISTAQAIKHMAEHYSQAHSLGFYWDLKGHFTPQGKLGFTLFSHRYSPLLWELGIHRKRINQEIKQLAEYIEKSRGVLQR